MKASRGAARRLPAAIAGLAAGAGTLIGAVPASAVIRYADPGSATSTGACGEFAPCTVGYAIQGAVGGDEVVVRPGNYGSDAARMTSTIAGAAPGLYIHGVAGQPRPRLYFAVARYAVILGGPVTVSDLEIDNRAGYGLNVHGGGAGVGSLLERIEVSAAGTGSVACALDGGVIRDSVCLSQGTGGRSVYVGPSGNATVTVRNVTALATAAGGTSVYAIAGVSRTLDVIVRNTIARGERDLEADTRDPAGAATIHVGHSNFATRSTATATSAVIDDPADSNQSAAPLLADPRPTGLAIDGDYRQLQGSPTIDAGEQDPANGTLDVSGGPRTVGASTDIGADEFDPPASGPGGGIPQVLGPAWWATPAATASLIVAPKRVARGGVVTIWGSVAGGCLRGTRVALYSPALRGATDRRFAGLPAVFAMVRDDSTFSTRIQLARDLKPGGYTVGGSCAGGQFGSAMLRVASRAISRPKQAEVEGPFVRSVSKLEPRARRLFPGTFAGTWLGSGTAAGDVFIAFTAHAGLSAARLRRGLPRSYRRRVRVVVVKRSLRVLEQLEARMIRDRELIRRGTAPLGAFPGPAYDIDIDIKRNTPVVTVEHRTRAVVDAFRQRYGRLVVVEQGPLLQPDACTRDDCGQLLRAGRWMYRTSANGHIAKICTTGFTVREQVRRDHQRLGVLSAGHCSRLDEEHLGTENPYTDRGARLGGHLYKFGNRVQDVMQGSVDAEWSTDNLPPFTAGNACVFVAIPHIDYCGVVRQVASSFDELPVGLTLCKSGALTGESCGQVLSKHVSPSYIPNATNFIRASFCSQPGDSGSPVFLRSGRFYEAVGILSGGPSYLCGDPRDTAVFSHLEFVQKQLHVRVLTWDRVHNNGICTAPTTCTPAASEP